MIIYFYQCQSVFRERLKVIIEKITISDTHNWFNLRKKIFIYFFSSLSRTKTEEVSLFFVDLDDGSSGKGWVVVRMKGRISRETSVVWQNSWGYTSVVWRESWGYTSVVWQNTWGYTSVVWRESWGQSSVGHWLKVDMGLHVFDS